MGNYTKSRRIEFSYEYYNKEVKDPYIWLENAKEEEVIKWVDEQNNYTDNYFENIEKYSSKELAQKLKLSSKSVSYYGEYELGEFIFAGKQNENGETSAVILDKEYNEIETIADGNMFNKEFTIFGAKPSPLNNGICAISALAHGAPRPSTLIYNYIEKRLLKRIDGLFSGLWSRDGETYYYSDAQVNHENNTNSNYIRTYNYRTHQTNTIYKHTKHSPFIILKSSIDGKYIFAEAMHDYTSCDLLKFKDEEKDVKPLVTDISASFKYIGTVDDIHFIITNHDAPYSKIISIDDSNSNYNNTNTIIPESNKIIDAAVVTDDEIVVSFMNDVVSEISVFNTGGKYLRNIDLPSDMGTVLDRTLASYEVKKSPNIYFQYESFTNPQTTLRYNTKSKELDTVYINKHVKEKEDIVVKREFITSRDGVKIPAFIVHKKDINLDSNNPTLMYGYGGYNASMPPMFTNPFVGVDIVDWVEKGYVYVNCNIRGGSEYGSKWHTGGNLKNKKNVFNDFIDITEWLIDNKYTKPEKIAICGGSNGGLLMTALITMRPDLWGAVIASVPHTDMIRFINDDRGPMYITEYGNPMEEEMFEYMLSYSPYHNIKATMYPSIYIQTGECDNNVPPYHAKKFAARMQALNMSDNPVLLRVLKDGSHDRGKGDIMYKTHAEMQVFIANALKL